MSQKESEGVTKSLHESVRVTLSQEEAEGVRKKSQLRSYWINVRRNKRTLFGRSQMNKEETGGVHGGQGKPREVGRTGKQGRNIRIKTKRGVAMQ